MAQAPKSVMTLSGTVFVIATATIIAALAFQYIGGYAPCALCLEERYAYYFAIPAAFAAWFAARVGAVSGARILLGLIALVFLFNVGLGVYHAGIEWKWWTGPQACAGGFELAWGEGGIVETPVIRCDEAQWRLFGLSFAGWNAVMSAILAFLAIFGATRSS